MVPAGDLSEEVDEVQSCGVKPPGEGEEEGYDADSESNPEDMAKQEEGRSTLAVKPHTHRHTHPSLRIYSYRTHLTAPNDSALDWLLATCVVCFTCKSISADLFPSFFYFPGIIFKNALNLLFSKFSVFCNICFCLR